MVVLTADVAIFGGKVPDSSRLWLKAINHEPHTGSARTLGLIIAPLEYDPR